MRQTHLETLASGFDGVGREAILNQCRMAMAWCESNPAKRKTSGGMPSFLFKWIERHVNDGSINRKAASGGRSQPSVGIHESAGDVKW